jgi:hypothetical protein
MSKFKEIWAESIEGNTMKAEELADKIEDRSRFGCETEEQATKRHILACKAAAAELRRLAALEQAAQNNPSFASAWAQGYRTGINDERESETNIGAAGFGAKIEPARANPYTHPARKPMTRDDMRKLLAEHFDNGDLTGDDFRLIRAVERFHDIKE